MKNKPVLVVIAGPNGAAKIAITKKLLKHHWLNINNTKLCCIGHS